MPFSQVCRQVQCFRMPRSNSREPFCCICRQVRCFRAASTAEPFSRICRQVQCSRRPRNNPGGPFSWICRQVQCFRMILVISVISAVLGALGWFRVVSGSRFLGFVDRCTVFEGPGERESFQKLGGAWSSLSSWRNEHGLLGRCICVYVAMDICIYIK